MLPSDWREMEDALAAAWPVPWSVRYDEFELRASPEESNRGNCARIRTERPNLDSLLRAAEPFFERNGGVVQVAVPGPLLDTDQDLVARGFKIVDPSFIMSREAPGSAPPSIPADLTADLRAAPDREWLRGWEECAEAGPERSPNLSVFLPDRGRACFVSLRDDAGSVVAVGSSVCYGKWRCLGNLATRRGARGRGIGRLVLRILAARPAAGIERDVLQVDRGNGARRLYESEGFRLVYPYHYRRLPNLDPEVINDPAPR
jgi:ribosomal protein S18 acetylase RimI-like enzyme